MESFEHAGRTWWFIESEQPVLERTSSYAPHVKAPSLDAAKELIDGMKAAMTAYTMNEVSQHLTTCHSSSNFEQPTGIVLDGSHGGFNFDKISELLIEDTIERGTHVFCVTASFTEWGGTFGQSSSESRVVAITTDAERAKALVEHLNVYGNIKPDGYSSEDGWMPWHGHGNSLDAVTIQYLPVL